MTIHIPEFCVVALVGVSGSGKSTFAAKHFRKTEVLSSDYFRGLVCDDELDQSVSKQAFEALYHVAAKRLENKKLTVIDATNVQKEARKEILNLAKKFHCFSVAIVLNISESIAVNRNKQRTDRFVGPGPIARQMQNLKKSIRSLKDEGFRYIYVLNSLEEIESLEIRRDKLWTNRAEEKGPFDIIGDVHGCYEELTSLLIKLGYEFCEPNISLGFPAVSSPHGRKVIFLGDLVDRGPRSPEVVKLVMNMVQFNQALCVAGNHDVKLVKYLTGRKVKLTHGLQESAEQFEKESSESKKVVREFLDKLVSHYVLDEGRLVVCHAGLKEDLQGRSSIAVREFAMYGETTGEVDEFGLLMRTNWAKNYRGKALVAYGHTPVVESHFINNTICLDTGCVFGGQLTALRYPEREFVSVPSKRLYYEPLKPLKSEKNTDNDLYLQINDILSKKRIETSLLGPVEIKAENSNAALEVMSRFALDPRWLIYLPPTMAPSNAKTKDNESNLNLLEHPTQGINYFNSQGVQNLILEEKHMGSRAVMVLCKDESIPSSRFLISEKKLGVIYTRTGRPFFTETEIEKVVLLKTHRALTASGFWKKFNTDWVCLDMEILPWTIKAMDLLKSQYAAVGAAANGALPPLLESIKTWNQRKLSETCESIHFKKWAEELAAEIGNYVYAYRRYSTPFLSHEDIKLAPFHILATEQGVHTDKSHLWHMEEISKICDFDLELFKKTKYVLVDTKNEDSISEAVLWWEQIAADGGEGCVIKTLDFLTHKEGRLIQPMLKCRGPEYLRIIYGPTYLQPDHLERLKKRNILPKQRLAIKEFSLGIEALRRFVQRSSLWQVHECVFGILALESEPIDPRL